MGYGVKYGDIYGNDKPYSYTYAIGESDTIAMTDAAAYEMTFHEEDPMVVTDSAQRGATFERGVDDWRRISRP